MKLTSRFSAAWAAKNGLFQGLLCLCLVVLTGTVLAQTGLTNINSGTINPNLMIQNQQGPTVGTQKLTINQALGASRYGPEGRSSAACGGIVNGKVDRACTPTAATFSGDAVGACPAGSFADVGKGGCYTCPAGYIRTADAVDSDRACAKADTSVKGGFMSAVKGGSACAKGFSDPIRDGECWSCPEGYQRSAAHIQAPNACYIPVHDDLARATQVKKTPWPHECGGGSFHDASNGGACWTCPAGYNRSAYPITDARACSRLVPEQPARAKLEGVSSCKEGEFFDPRNGGECWSCPATTTRTVFPVQEAKACERWAGYRYSKATQVSNWSCGIGAFLDLIPSSDNRVMARIRKQYGSKPIPSGLGSGKGGTCWSCPAGRGRTTAPVYDDAACDGPLVEWQPAAWRQPGLFGLDGGEAVVQDLIKERNLIEAIAASLAPSLNKTAAIAVQDAWGEIVTRPQSSSVLALAALSRIEAAAVNPRQASAAELKLLASFAEASRAFKEYQAQTALDAYDAWNVAVIYKRNKAAQTNAQASVWGAGGLSDVPDFEAIALETVLGGMGAGTGVAVAGSLAMIPERSFNAIFPHQRKGIQGAARALKMAEGDLQRVLETVAMESVERTTGRSANKVVSKAVQEATEKVAQRAAILAGREAAQKALSVLSEAGPQIIIGFAIDLAMEAAMRIEQIENARPRLLAKLAESKQALDIGRLMLTERGGLSVEEMWTLAMGSENPPQNLSAIVALAQASAQAQRSTALSSGSGAAKVTTPSSIKVAAAITKQVDAADVQGHALVELLTVVTYPNALTPVNLKAPGSVVLVSSSQDASACPASPGQCKQRFSLRLDTRNNGCSLNGDYIAEFQVSCQPNGPTAQCLPGIASVPFKLTGSTTCTKR